MIKKAPVISSRLNEWKRHTLYNSSFYEVYEFNALLSDIDTSLNIVSVKG